MAEQEVTSKTQANCQMLAITQYPLLNLDKVVCHGGCSGKYDLFTIPCNAESGLLCLPNCIAVPNCLLLRELGSSNM